MFQCLLERIRDDVGWLIDIPQAMSFINNDHVPGDGMHIGGFIAGELIRTDDYYIVALKRAELSLLDRFIVGAGFENSAGQEKLFAQLLMPLLPEIGGSDNQDTALTFRPLLRDNQSRLNGLAQTNLISQKRTTRKRRIKRKESSIHLMRIKVYLRACDGASELLRTIGGTPFCQVVSIVFSMIVGNVHEPVNVFFPIKTTL